MKFKKALIFLLSAVFCFSVSSVLAQKKTSRKSSAKSLKIKQQKLPKTISGGVVNGKAIDLVVPVCPQEAKKIGLYGKVEVQVLINIDGKVLTAEAISGNPILRSSSIKAALKSSFVPIKIGGEFVRVSGIINYIFLPETLNWLEIGYSLQNARSGYYSALKVENYFPDGFEEEIQLLKQSTEDQTGEIVIASIESKLSRNPKDLWLFSIGSVLGKLKENCCRVEEKTQISAQEIRILIQTKPANISNGLISNLEKLIFYIENSPENIYLPGEGSKVDKTLKKLEENFWSFGR